MYVGLCALKFPGIVWQDTLLLLSRFAETLPVPSVWKGRKWLGFDPGLYQPLR